MPATRTFLQAADDGTNLTTYTFAGQNLGAADAGRYIVVCVESRASLARTISTVTVGGVSASIAVQVSNGNNVAGIAIAAVPTGTTGDVVVTFSGSVLRAAVQLYRVLGIDSATPADFDSSAAADPTVNLDVPAGGVAFGCVLTTSTGTTAWTGLTEDHDSVVESAVNVSSASGEFASTQTGLTITADVSASSTPVGAFASWAPAAGGGGFIDNTTPVLSAIYGGGL